LGKLDILRPQKARVLLKVSTSKTEEAIAATKIPVNLLPTMFLESNAFTLETHFLCDKGITYCVF